MKFNIARHITKMTLLGIAAAAVYLSASVVAAQSVPFRWEFTLPYEAHWGRATLPSGDYVLTFEYVTMHEPPTAVVRDAKSLRIVAYEPLGIREDSTKGDSALLIATRRGRRIIHSLRIAQLGQVFVYDPALAHAHVVEQVGDTPVVPVVVAEK